MKIIETKLNGVLIIEPDMFGDNRGWFFESYSKKNFPFDIEFVQDNHSFSIEKGILRGLHFQLDPKSQAKLVRCTRGALLDVAVDLRKSSPTYKKWISVELSAENRRQLFIQKGFAHGFLTLTDNVEIQYKTNEYYSPEHDRSIKWNDCNIGVEWGIDKPILSKKDENAPLLKDSDVNFE